MDVLYRPLYEVCRERMYSIVLKILMIIICLSYIVGAYPLTVESSFQLCEAGRNDVKDCKNHHGCNNMLFTVTNRLNS